MKTLEFRRKKYSYVGNNVAYDNSVRCSDNDDSLTTF